VSSRKLNPVTARRMQAWPRLYRLHSLIDLSVDKKRSIPPWSIGHCDGCDSGDWVARAEPHFARRHPGGDKRDHGVDARSRVGVDPHGGALLPVVWKRSNAWPLLEATLGSARWWLGQSQVPVPVSPLEPAAMWLLMTMGSFHGSLRFVIDSRAVFDCKVGGRG
jgi:hypothetical protein